MQGVHSVTESVSERSPVTPSASLAEQVPIKPPVDSETPATPAPASDEDLKGPLPTEPILSRRQRRVYGIIGVLVALLIVALLVFLGYLMFMSYDWAAEGVVPATVRLRDIAFIVLGVESLVIMVLVIAVIILLIIVVVLIHEKLIPTIEQINKSMNAVSRSITEVSETVHTVRGTTTFVSNKVVTPFIELSSYATGAARIFKGILDLWPRGSQSDDQQGPPATGE
jgi:cell division protein FtsL